MPYEIIATLGPSSRAAPVWAEMLEAGATAFRLNTSHLTLDALAEWLEKLETFFASYGRVPLALDLQGSKWRLGMFKARELALDEQVTLALAEHSGEPGVLPVPHADFFRAAPLSSAELALNDAKARLVVERVEDERIQARVTQPGPVGPRKGITYAQSGYRVEDWGERDRAVLESTRGMAQVQYAISYVKDAEEMARYRLRCDAILGRRASLAAKLERPQAMEGAAQIAETLVGRYGSGPARNTVWVCRGDLGAEMGLPGMARAVARLTSRLAALPAPALLAGQVLEHMTVSATPTRSEVCCLHDALAQGYRGFVLSDETAVGSYPVESVQAAAMFLD